MKRDENIDNIRIAPKKRGGDWTIGDYRSIDFEKEEGWQKAIDIFEDRIQGRFLNVVEKIKSYLYAGFAMLAIDCLLIETLQQFRKGVSETPRGEGKEYFTCFLRETAFKEYFHDREIAEMFYDQIRNGILHQAEIKETSRIGLWPEEMVCKTKDGQGLIINRNQFHEKLVEVFTDYTRQLRDPKNEQLRRNFKRKMDYICRRDLWEGS